MAQNKTNKKEKSIVLLSGGLDSSVTLSVASMASNPCLLHVNYGQLTEKRELKSFNDLKKHFKIKESLTVDVDYFRQIGHSALTDKKIKVPTGKITSNKIPVTYVPFRNANLLSIAVSWAEAINATSIYIGAVEEDSSGYPDCRKEFFKSFQDTINKGTKPDTKIKIITPLINLSKAQIVRKGSKLQTPFHLTWSCYKSETKACGVCDSCMLRLKGFKEAKAKDPIAYK